MPRTVAIWSNRFIAAAALCSALGWAATGDIVARGVGNFHQVDAHIYRGAQPTRLGIQSLAKLGIKTVIDLREGREHAGVEEKLVKAAGMRYVNVPMKGLSAPTKEQMAKVLALLDDSSGWPVFVHCRRGADRTGTVIACYRISHELWANQKALEEARLFGMSWVERAMQHYILSFAAPKPEIPQSGLKPLPASP